VKKLVLDAGIRLLVCTGTVDQQPMIPQVISRRILALSVANFLGACLYVSLAVVRGDRARRAGITPDPLQWQPAYWVLLLFVMINAVWGMVALVRARQHRWDFYVFAWGIWIFAVILGSGALSV
jgi:hypothetical protein